MLLIREVKSHLGAFIKGTASKTNTDTLKQEPSTFRPRCHWKRENIPLTRFDFPRASGRISRNRRWTQPEQMQHDDDDWSQKRFLPPTEQRHVKSPYTLLNTDTSNGRQSIFTEGFFLDQTLNIPSWASNSPSPASI